MKIWIENYNAAKLHVPEEPTIAVRVFDPGARPYRLANARWSDYPEDCWDNTPAAPFNKKAYLAVFEYTFEDCNLDVSSKERQNQLLSDPTRTLFTAPMAENLLIKFKETYEQATALMAHCNAGASRSVALARALILIFDLKPKFQGRSKRFAEGKSKDYIGNAYVYRLMLEAATRLSIS